MRKSISSAFLMAAGLLLLSALHAFPQSGDAVISTDTTWPSGTYNLNSLRVTNSATLTLQGSNTTGQVGGQWQGQVEAAMETGSAATAVAPSD